MNLTDEEIITRIAVEVMGWERRKDENSFWFKVGKTGVSSFTGFAWDKELHPEIFWDPLSNWNHTMQVMEEIKPQWIRFTDALEEISGTPVWEDILYEMDSRRICLAALQAISSPSQ